MAKTIGYSPDELWKAIIEDLFDEFLEYFMPELYEQIDFTKGYIFLEQELKKLFRESKNKKRITDKLVKVYLKNGDEKWILIHIEIQGYNDDEFTRRMFKYFYRIYDKYEKDINAIAIFTDDKKDYKPDKYEYKFLGTKVTYEYNTYKILEQTEEKLLQDKNLFALVILAGLYSIKCEKIKEQKYKFKLNLIRLLRQRKYTNEKIQIIFDFIEGIIRLPETEEKLYKEEIEKNLKGG
ncbi:MAG TPA: hypothetical protein DEG71_04250, partial [Clostridiales bacterium]|nr:hypothetical protein [Clostridiales bacterium]